MAVLRKVHDLTAALTAFTLHWFTITGACMCVYMCVMVVSSEAHAWMFSGLLYTISKYWIDWPDKPNFMKFHTGSFIDKETVGTWFPIIAGSSRRAQRLCCG